MLVKYNANGEIVSLFVGCVPDDAEGYVEIPDDDKIVADYIKANTQKPEVTDQTQEQRIKALEDQLAAYEAAYAQGVREA